MKGKKIIFIIPLYSSFKLFLKDITKHLLDIGFEVVLITNNNKNEEKIEGLKIYHLEIPRGLNVFQYLKSASTIRKIVLKEKPDIVHAHFTPAILATRLARIFKKTKTFAMAHGLLFNSRNSKLKMYLFLAIEYFAYKPFNVLYVINNKDLIDGEKYFNNVEKLTDYGLGCDTQKFSRNTVDLKHISNLKNELNISSTDFILIYVGRYVSFKGYDIVIRSFEKLSKKYNNLKLITLGANDPIHKTGLNDQEEIKRNENPNIIDIGFTNDVKSYLYLSHLLFFPSQKEGMPVNMLESTAMGVPIVTYKSRGCEEIVTDNYNGRILNTLAYEAYVKVIEELILDKEQLKQYIEKQISLRPQIDRDVYINKQILEYKNILNIK